MVSIIRTSKNLDKTLKGFEKDNNGEYFQRHQKMPMFTRNHLVHETNGKVNDRLLNRYVKQAIIEKITIENSDLFNLFYFLGTNGLDSNKEIKIVWSIDTLRGHRTNDYLLIDIHIFFKSCVTYSLCKLAKKLH